MAGEYIEIGDAVKDSPNGCGTVTDITDAGYPRVNHIAVAWLERDDGAIFDPRGVRSDALAKRAAQQKDTP
jgi:hypothetical protein